MANASTNTIVVPYGKGGRDIITPVKGSTHLYEGRIVCQSGGFLVPVGSGGAVCGIMRQECNNAGADGAVRARITTDQTFCLPNATAGDACDETLAIGSVVYAKDDHTIANNSNSGAWPAAGFFMGMEAEATGASEKVRVYISARNLFTPAVDVGALTLAAVAGTANTTLEALPAPTDSPATADALRDDIVATLLPPLRNNFADLATQVNAIRTALRNAGLMA